MGVIKPCFNPLMHFLQMWRKRWFVLLSSKVLEYYKSEGGEQKGVINLEDCHSVNANLSHKRYIYVTSCLFLRDFCECTLKYFPVLLWCYDNVLPVSMTNPIYVLYMEKMCIAH